MCKTGANRRKKVQTGANPKNVIPLNPKGFLTHVYLCLSEHPDTICREKCKTTAFKNLWRADFSKRNTLSFTSVNARFRAETQRHVNLRYFGGPRMTWLDLTWPLQPAELRAAPCVWGFAKVLPGTGGLLLASYTQVPAAKMSLIHYVSLRDCVILLTHFPLKLILNCQRFRSRTPRLSRDILWQTIWPFRSACLSIWATF